MRGSVVLIFAALLEFSSCTPRGVKAAAPVMPAPPAPVVVPVPAPPQPLSSPQTRVVLPEPQPFDPAALETESTAQDTPPVMHAPAAPKRTTVTQPVTPAPVTPPATTPQAEPPRGAIQEVISSTELKRLTDQVQGRRREVTQILEQASKRRLSQSQQNDVNNIRNFLTLSLEAEQRNDIRGADALAERALILARDLQNGK